MTLKDINFSVEMYGTTAVVTRYPQFKEGIDEILFADGFGHLIAE